MSLKRTHTSRPTFSMNERPLKTIFIELVSVVESVGKFRCRTHVTWQTGCYVIVKRKHAVRLHLLFNCIAWTILSIFDLCASNCNIWPTIPSDSFSVFTSNFNSTLFIFIRMCARSGAVYGRQKCRSNNRIASLSVNSNSSNSYHILHIAR